MQSSFVAIDLTNNKGLLMYVFATTFIKKGKCAIKFG